MVAAPESQTERYVVIDGYKRIAALEQLRRDTVEAVVWPMSEAAAVLLDRSMRWAEHETASEVGWLLGELEQGMSRFARIAAAVRSWFGNVRMAYQAGASCGSIF